MRRLRGLNSDPSKNIRDDTEGLESSRINFNNKRNFDWELFDPKTFCSEVCKFFFRAVRSAPFSIAREARRPQRRSDMFSPSPMENNASGIWTAA